jgi:glutathione S-transferase
MMGQVNWFKHYNGEANENALSRYEAQAYRCFDVLEGHLKATGGRYILKGDGPSAVDFHYEPWLKQYAFAGLKLDGHPGVKKWLEQVQSLEEVKEAYEKVGKGEEVKA